MKVILSKNITSLTGSLGRGFGYYISKRGKNFYAVRNSKGVIPPDGHWRFIESCARLAKSGLHIADIKVGRQELELALYQAHHFIAMMQVDANARTKGKHLYNAQDILNLKTTFGL